MKTQQPSESNDYWDLIVIFLCKSTNNLFQTILRARELEQFGNCLGTCDVSKLRRVAHSCDQDSFQVAY